MKSLLAALPFFSDSGSEQESKVQHDSQIYMSDSDSVDAQTEHKELVVRRSTGVERYLKDIPQKTGVSKYLDSTEIRVVSGVEKYLKNQPDSSPSGVAKYMANQLVTVKSSRALSGVDKYVKNQALNKKEPHIPSSVEQYVGSHQTDKNVSTVGKYVAKKVAASRIKFDVTGVDKYQLEKDVVERKQAAAEIVERYLQQQAIITKEKIAAEREASEIAEREARIVRSLAELESESDKELSKVALYVKQHAVLDKEKPVVTSVSKYIAKKIVETSKQTPASKVEKYLAKQSVNDKLKPVVSSVESYLASKALAEKSAPVLSSVEKYVSKKSVADRYKPELSGVAKYLASVRSAVNVAATFVEKSLEGEFIPAAYVDEESSVDRYLEEKAVSDLESRPTGVELYLRDQVQEEEAIVVEDEIVDDTVVVSGVDKYLQNHSESNNDENLVVQELVEDQQAPVLSGVEKYLLANPAPIKKELVLSSVDKYMEKKAVIDKEIAIANATGVEKYLMNAAAG